VLKEKVLAPQFFLPVEDVVTRPSDDGRGTYREMTLNHNGNERRIIENIYCDESIFEVKFCVVDDPTEHVNIITADETTGLRRLEFYLRNKETKERAHWHAPKVVGQGGIAKVLEKARTI